MNEPKRVQAVLMYIGGRRIGGPVVVKSAVVW